MSKIDFTKLTPSMNKHDKGEARAREAIRNALRDGADPAELLGRIQAAAAAQIINTTKPANADSTGAATQVLAAAKVARSGIHGRPELARMAKAWGNRNIRNQ